MGRHGLGTFALFSGTAALAAAAAASLLPSPAQACGGLFCSSSNPVNQAAEQIVFAHNPDGTVTAIIQIMYDGPAHEFAWVLPMPGVPEVGVSSDQALDALKQVTNPLYQLTTTFGGSCGGVDQSTSAPRGAADFDNAESGGNSGVTVEASGAIGPYDYRVLSFDPELDDPADVAIEWLTENAFDVGELGPDVLRPYLAEGLNLLAFRLTKGNSTGSIRPVMITYEAEQSSIPIRPTAVAANDDMGVLVWVLADARAVPENYKSLELNEGLLDWFNPNNNYNEVVTRAADEAMGQGFVTEYAGRHQDLGIQVFGTGQRQQWNEFMIREQQDPVQMVQEATSNWGGYDGIDDALRAAVTLPDAISFDDFRRCMRCYVAEQGVVFDTQVYLDKLFEFVIKPLLDTQDLLDSLPYMTRFYTTMSADEMTLDPIFAVNEDLDDYSNVHVAEQVMECDGNAWTVNLPEGGGSVRGFEAGVWPVEPDDAPAARKILQYGTEGQGRVVDDRTDEIGRMLKERNQRTTQAAIDDGTFTPDDGCSAAGGVAERTPSLLLLALAALIVRLRRARAGAVP